MNIKMYEKLRAERKSQEEQFRSMCLRCFQISKNCYCPHLKNVKTEIKFIILIHPIEFRRRIATGRMAHLSLENSKLVMPHDPAGYSYINSPVVNHVLRDPAFHSVLLYPGANAKNLSEIKSEERLTLAPPGKKLAVFVVDGTWNTARKTVHVSENLKGLPRICFSPSRPSNFRVRKQPQENFFSTIEAIHETLELLQDPSTHTREHDRLLYVFDKMVETQLSYANRGNCRHTRYKTADNS